MSKYSSRLGFGVIAGVVGGIIMIPLLIYVCSTVSDTFMMAMKMSPMPMMGPQPILVAMGMTIVPGADANTAANAALVMHMVTALVIGVIFALVTTALYKPQGVRKVLGAADAGSGLAVGLLYGVIVWIVFFLPLLMNSFLPNLAAMTAMDTKMDVGMVTMEMLNSVGTLAMELTLVSHLIYGAVIGLIVGGLTQWKKTLS